MKKDKKVLIGISAIVVVILLFVGAGYLPFLQSGLTSSQWTKVGTIPRVDIGGTIDIGSKVTSYNSQIANQDKFIIDANNFNNCQLPLSRLTYFKQNYGGNHEYISLYSNGNYYDEDMTLGSINGAIFAQCGGSWYKMYINGGIGCNSIPSNEYENYGLGGNSSMYNFAYSCGSTGGIDVYVLSASIQDFTCTTDQYRTCNDGSQIKVESCINHQYQSTGNRCPVVARPTPTNAQPTVSPSTNTTTVNPQCAPDYISTISCPNGANVIVQQCTNGQIVNTNSTCPMVQQPPSIVPDNSIIYLVGGIVLLVIIGAIYVFIIKK